MGRFHRLGMIFAFLVIIICAYMGIRMVFIEDKNAEVPAVTGMQLVDAVDALQSKGLLAKVDKVDSSQPADIVVSQNLPAGEKVSRGKVVLLRVSKGGAIQLVPDVRGMKFEDGVRKLSDAGFKVDRIVRVTDKLKSSGVIIAQNPASPQQVSANCMVSLLVSSGAKGESAFVTIPDLRGKDRQAATEMIEQLSLRAGAVTETPSASQPVGSVLASSPRAGARVPLGSIINLSVAREPLPTDTVTETPPENDQDTEKAEAVKKVVIKETSPSPIPSKLPAIKEPAVKQPSATATEPAKKQPDAKTEPKPAVTQTPAPAQVKPAAPQEEAKPQESQTPKKYAKIRYQVPPLAKPLALKIELTDASGTRVLQDSMAKSGEYITKNVPYTGEARISIFLGGEFVWQDRFN